MNLLNFQSNYALESYDNIHLERIKISYDCPYRIYKKKSWNKMQDLKKEKS